MTAGVTAKRCPTVESFNSCHIACC